MKKQAIQIAIILLGITVLLGSGGCTSVSPALLQLPAERAGTASLPIKVGILRPEKLGSQRLSHVRTCALLGIYQFQAKMPRRSELDYLGMAMGDYFRDTKAFSYCYNEPFDRKDVQLILRPEIKEMRLSNSAYGTCLQHSGIIPVVGIFISLSQLLGMPQERFKISYEIDIHAELPSGKLVKTYTVKGKAADFVNLYEQPFANYMWYSSVFSREFFAGMDRLKTSLENDIGSALKVSPTY